MLKPSRVCVTLLSLGSPVTPRSPSAHRAQTGPGHARHRAPPTGRAEAPAGPRPRSRSSARPARSASASRPCAAPCDSRRSTASATAPPRRPRRLREGPPPARRRHGPPRDAEGLRVASPRPEAAQRVRAALVRALLVQKGLLGVVPSSAPAGRAADERPARARHGLALLLVSSLLAIQPRVHRRVAPRRLSTLRQAVGLRRLSLTAQTSWAGRFDRGGNLCLVNVRGPRWRMPPLAAASTRS